MEVCVLVSALNRLIELGYIRNDYFNDGHV